MNTMGRLRSSADIQRHFNGRRRLRKWRNVHFGGMAAAKAHPLGFCRFRPDEGGTVSTSLNLKLAPVSGHMRSKAYVDVVQIFVPYQAIEKMHLDGQQEDAGVTEMTRRRLMKGDGIGLANFNTISEAGNVHPRSVGGTKKVSRTVQLAYNCAVNHLRKSAYYDAEELKRGNFDIAPAVLTANVLERFNGVLDPERNIDGAINLTGELPLKGITKMNANFDQTANRTAFGSGGEDVSLQSGDYSAVGDEADNNMYFIQEDPNNPGHPNLYVDLDGTSEITLRDMVESQKLDQIVRGLAHVIQKDPINGEEAVERMLYKISVDYDANCQVMYRKVYELSASHHRPSDGASINDVSGHFMLDTQFATLVPRSELGGQLVTICMVKPLEVLSEQPDPAQTEAWELVNVIHDETQLDEKLLTRADLQVGVSAANEDQPAFWVGHNSLAHEYSTQGPNSQQTGGVDLKSTMWIYEIPTSLTPSNINYPDGGIQMYPFYNWNGPHAEYTFSQTASISTSLAKGPNPIEKIKLFDDNPGLIDDEAAT